MRQNRMTILAALAVCACQHASAETKAVLADDTEPTLGALKDALSEHMERDDIQFGVSDPTEQPIVSVLPRSLGADIGMSLALPTLFDLVLKDSVCFAIERETREAVALPNVPCRPA